MYDLANEAARIVQYTDGSWIPPEEHGQECNLPAGYGVAEFRICNAQEQDAVSLAQITRMARRSERDGSPAHQSNGDVHTGLKCEYGVLSAAHSGMVETDRKKPGWIGAKAHTNNTGELTAMHIAICRALKRPRGTGREDIWSDSLYTINMTTGKWTPKSKRNAHIVGDLHSLWRRLQRERPREVKLRHVRSHIKIPGNELADWLADQGREERNVSRVRQRKRMD